MAKELATAQAIAGVLQRKFEEVCLSVFLSAVTVDPERTEPERVRGKPKAKRSAAVRPCRRVRLGYSGIVDRNTDKQSDPPPAPRIKKVESGSKRLGCPEGQRPFGRSLFKSEKLPICSFLSFLFPF